MAELMKGYYEPDTENSDENKYDAFAQESCGDK
jgi:hypothetical protein